MPIKLQYLIKSSSHIADIESIVNHLKRHLDNLLAHKLSRISFSSINRLIIKQLHLSHTRKFPTNER